MGSFHENSGGGTPVLDLTVSWVGADVGGPYTGDVTFACSATWAAQTARWISWIDADSVEHYVAVDYWTYGASAGSGSVLSATIPVTNLVRFYFGMNENGAGWKSVSWYRSAAPTPTPAGSAASNLPLLFPGDTLPDGLSTDVVLDAPVNSPVNAWDAAQDLLDRSGQRLVDYGDGWVVEPAVPVEGDVVCEIAYGSNLIRAESSLDIDQADHAQQVLLEYTWIADDGSTTTRRAWSSPSYGPHTLLVTRSGIPATEGQAQDAADVLGARAWMRGRSITVEIPLAAWIRPLHTVGVHLPGGTRQTYWVDTATHDSVAGTTSLMVRPFIPMGLYPAD